MGKRISIDKLYIEIGEFLVRVIEISSIESLGIFEKTPRNGHPLGTTFGIYEMVFTNGYRREVRLTPTDYKEIKETLSKLKTKEDEK